MAEEKYVTLAEAREMLVKENEERLAGINGKREFLPTQSHALSAASAYPLSEEAAKDLVAKIMELDFMTPDLEYYAYKIADLLPAYSNDVRAIFSKSRLNLDADMIQKILDIVDSY